MNAKSDDVIHHPVGSASTIKIMRGSDSLHLESAGKLTTSVGSRTGRTLGMNNAAPRLTGHWLHGSPSKVKASIDGCVMHDNGVELGAAFGRFCLRSTESGTSLVGTFAWTGRALQANVKKMEGLVLRICIRP